MTVARSEAASEKKYRANQISLSEIRWASPSGLPRGLRAEFQPRGEMHSEIEIGVRPACCSCTSNRKLCFMEASSALSAVAHLPRLSAAAARDISCHRPPPRL